MTRNMHCLHSQLTTVTLVCVWQSPQKTLRGSRWQSSKVTTPLVSDVIKQDEKYSYIIMQTTAVLSLVRIILACDMMWPKAHVNAYRQLHNCDAMCCDTCPNHFIYTSGCTESQAKILWTSLKGAITKQNREKLRNYSLLKSSCTLFYRKQLFLPVNRVHSHSTYKDHGFALHICSCLPCHHGLAIWMATSSLNVIVVAISL